METHASLGKVIGEFFSMYYGHLLDVNVYGAHKVGKRVAHLGQSHIV